MSKSKDLHGNAPDKSKVALLLIDMISDFEFPDGEKLFKHALPMAKKLLSLKKKAKKFGVPIIYVNDNFGRWQSNFNNLLEHALDESVRGSEISTILKPEDDDYFVLKPKHSGFFSTTLEVLLEYLEVNTLILTGVTTDVCILFTANDAYVRDFNLFIPSDCAAAINKKDYQHTLKFAERVLKANTQLSTSIDFDKLKSER